MRILYLDDNEINRFIVTKIIGKLFHVDCVEKASEAFDLYLKNSYNLVLLDINLNDPIIDGFGVLSNMKKIKKEEQIIFIAHTNYTTGDWEERCLNAGFDYYLPKPLEIEKFLSIIPA